MLNHIFIPRYSVTLTSLPPSTLWLCSMSNLSSVLIKDTKCSAKTSPDTAFLQSSWCSSGFSTFWKPQGKSEEATSTFLWALFASVHEVCRFLPDHDHQRILSPLIICTFYRTLNRNVEAQGSGNATGIFLPNIQFLILGRVLLKV